MQVPKAREAVVAVQAGVMKRPRTVGTNERLRNPNLIYGQYPHYINKRARQQNNQRRRIPKVSRANAHGKPPKVRLLGTSYKVISQYEAASLNGAPLGRHDSDEDGEPNAAAFAKTGADRS